MTDRIDRALAAEAAEIILAAYRAHAERFRALTARAKLHFERRDWAEAQRDSTRRLDLYTAAVGEGLERLAPLLGERLADRTSWGSLKQAFSAFVSGAADAELAETFFNSITRRIFHTIGVEPSVEFVSASAKAPPSGPPWSMTERFAIHGSAVELFREVLERYRFAVDYDDRDGDAARIASAVRAQLGVEPREIELARSVFYRNKGAYLVGRLTTDAGTVPLLLALTNPEGRVVVDAVLVTADEVSIVFSFARSYFFVDLERPRETIDFLRTIMPRKPLAELYNALGFNKHGKTELYRSLLRYLATSDDQFEIAPGQRGMVMCVFTLPGFDVVFKVIRDRFDDPKTVTHSEVRAKYRLVFHHDRAGRLVDAQEFEHLQFEARRFSGPLLEELATRAGETVKLRGEHVVVAHLYTERRLRPLDVYMREADAEAARDAVLDYGQALRDLAATNIFPGDMLLKNFGVSRHGRLIFYDYDELCPLTDCNFRRLPVPRDDQEETAGEPWFFVGERDVFPEEFGSFLGLTPELRAPFLAAHRELLAPEFWLRQQARHREGEILDVFPYRAARRLRPAAEESKP